VVAVGVVVGVGVGVGVAVAVVVAVGVGVGVVMTTLAELQNRVNSRVAEELVPALFERAVRVHEKRAWRDCDCDWCKRKRTWHGYLQYSPHGCYGREARENWRYNNVGLARRELAEEEQKVLS
jgi:hypothetical protein